MLVSESVNEFLGEQSCKGNTSSTLEYYGSMFRKFMSFCGDIPIDQLTVQNCKEYYFSLCESGLTSGSVQTYIRGLRAYLRWLYDSEYISTNICAKFKLPKAYRKTIDILTDSEIKMLYSGFSDDFLGIRNRCIISFMLGSGLRLNEVVTLEIKLLHLDDGYCIVNGKCQKQRIVPIGSVASEYIRQYLSIRPHCKSKYLFVKEDGGSITSNTVKDIFRRMKLRGGIPRIHPHLLRHTFATKYLENGGNIYSLQNILGHTSLEMVKRYLHLSQSRVNKDFCLYSPLDHIN